MRWRCEEKKNKEACKSVRNSNIKNGPFKNTIFKNWADFNSSFNKAYIIS